MREDGTMWLWWRDLGVRPCKLFTRRTNRIARTTSRCPQVRAGNEWMYAGEGETNSDGRVPNLLPGVNSSGTGVGG